MPRLGEPPGMGGCAAWKGSGGGAGEKRYSRGGNYKKAGEMTPAAVSHDQLIPPS